MMLPILEPPARLHFVGVAGAGMSSLAIYCAQAGFVVSGSDSAPRTDKVRALAEAGVLVWEGHDAARAQGADAVVVSSGVPAGNPEVVATQARGGRVLRRGELLAELVAAHPQGVAVCGTHGKGTTAGALAAMLEEAGHQVAWVLGAPLRTTQAAARFVPKAAFLIAEVDESDRTHLAHHPRHLLLNNLEEDHLNTYGSLGALVEGFVQLASQQAEGGQCVIGLYGAGAEPVRAATHRLGRAALTTAALSNIADIRGAQLSLCDVRGHIKALRVDDGGAALGQLSSPLRGELNARNLITAAAMAHRLGAGWAAIQRAAARYEGLRDRFDQWWCDGRLIITDYTSHPTSIEGNLRSLRGRVRGRLHAAFQPFRYSLMGPLWSRYLDALPHADMIHLLAMDSGGEAPVAGVSSQRLARALGAAHYDDLTALSQALQAALAPDDALIVFGGGALFDMARALAWSAPPPDPTTKHPTARA
jgi:UDP-N-acetylmuramate--alanine ligase